MPLSLSEIKRIFGDFRYSEIGHGRISIDPKWVASNIVVVSTRYGNLRFHVKAANQLKNALNEVYEKDPKLIDKADLFSSGGTFVPRHKMYDPHRSLSSHSWGIAIDVNVMHGKGGQMNIGKNSYQPASLVDIMKKWGFCWGGDWEGMKDGMHFEIIKLL